jgi:membrane complex biogenesis BtpA family protein
MNAMLEEIFRTNKPIIGMVHLPPLPLSPKWNGASYDQILDFALTDAENLEKGGVDGLIVENQNDVPFLTAQVHPVTVAFMAALVREIRRKVSIPIGVNVLFNDWQAELAIAEAGGAEFIRVEVLVDPSWSDMGFIPACAPELTRMRTVLRSKAKLFADVQGKYTYPCQPRPLVESARDAQARGLADALIITGTGTGKPASINEIRQVKESVSIPVLVGSGVNLENIGEMLSVADGVIIGSYLKVNGRLENPIDPIRVQNLMKIVRQERD